MQFSHKHILRAPVDDLRLHLERNDWGRFHLAIWGVVFALPGEAAAQSAIILLNGFVDWLQKKNFFRVLELIDHVGEVPDWRHVVMTKPNRIARAIQAVQHCFNR